MTQRITREPTAVICTPRARYVFFHVAAGRPCVRIVAKSEVA